MLTADNQFGNSRFWEQTNYSQVQGKIERLRRSIGEMETAFTTFTQTSGVAERVVRISK